MSLMAAHVSSLVRMISDRDMNESGAGGGGAAGGNSTALITKDLLGGSSSLDSQELDLDLHVPSGWEKRLDLKSGKVYLQKCNSSNKHSIGKLQDLNFPPSSSKPQLNLLDDSSLELKLVTSSSSSSAPSHPSVCTLEKVKSALERAEKESSRKRSISLSNSSSSPLSNSLSSTRDFEIDEEGTSGSYAAGCPRCLLYVLISRSCPRCPRCNDIVPSPTLDKKPRIDLNISM